MTKKTNQIRYKFVKLQRGSVLAWVAGAMVVLMGTATLVVDVGMIQHEVACLQRAADAAALAGAKQLPNESQALYDARFIADRNGYQHNTDDVTVTGTRNPDGMHSGWYQVEISTPVKFFFAPIMGYTDGVISINATAAYTTPLPLYFIGSGDEYGIIGIQNLCVLGPHAPYSYGDPYSTKWLNNGDDNPLYDETGFDFMVNVDANYFALNGTNDICIQLFDPDTWNINNQNHASSEAIDRICSNPSAVPSPGHRRNTTTFELYAPDNTPADFDDDVMIGSGTWGPDDTWSDMQWVTPTGWEFSLSEYGYGNYRVRTYTTDGSSENGFNMRAGPPSACTGDPDDWYPDNGTDISGLGTLPITFCETGIVNVQLGYIPPEAAGYDVYINKFDTDIGAKSVVYYDEYGNEWPGELAGNATFKLDRITIPEGYGGGNLYAEYAAADQDTSTWDLYFDGSFDGTPGQLRLVD